MCKRIGELLSGLVSRVEKLLEAGWKKVRIVTDHGWLLLPGGLPKSEMPGFLVETTMGSMCPPKNNVRRGCAEDTMVLESGSLYGYGPWY